MRYEILDAELRRMDADEAYVCGRFGPALHRAFRKVMSRVRRATDQRDLRALRGLNLEKLKGARKGQWSMRVDQQFRLIVVFKADDLGQRVVVAEMVDYH